MYISVEQKIKRRITQRIALLVSAAAVLGALLALSFAYCDLLERLFSVLLSVGLYALLFAKVKLIPLLRDQSWTGTVVSRACKKRTVVKGIPPKAEDRMFAYWKIQKDNGEETVVDFDIEDVADDYFKTGDRVRHYKGAKFIILDQPEADNENLLCPLCGKLVMELKCSFCRVCFDAADER